MPTSWAYARTRAPGPRTSLGRCRRYRLEALEQRLAAGAWGVNPVEEQMREAREDVLQ